MCVASRPRPPEGAGPSSPCRGSRGYPGAPRLRFIFFKPSARTMILCCIGVQIGLPTNLILRFAPVAYCLPLVRCLRRACRRPAPRALRGRATRTGSSSASDGRLHHVVRIVRADRLREHVRDAGGLDHGAHRSAGDDARTGRRRLQQHQPSAELAEHGCGMVCCMSTMRRRILLRGFDALLDGRRNFLGLARAVADDLAVPGRRRRPARRSSGSCRP